MAVDRVALALGLAVSAACTGAWALDRGWRRRAGAAALIAAFAAVLAAPLVVPPDRRFVRLLAGLVSVVAAVKLYDTAFDSACGRRTWAGTGAWARPGVRGFLAFLPNIFALVRREAGGLPRPSRREDLGRLARGAGAMLAGLLLFAAAFRVDWVRWPFAAEHAAKVVALYLVLVPAAAAGSAAWRLLGGPAMESMDNPFAARTPADFWRRYNRPAGQFFYEDVFKPVGGRRAPARAALVTFAASAAVHEYLFAVALGRVQGYQTAFFLAQGVASAATLRLRPRGPRAALGVAATLAFNLATSVLFFASLNGVVPFYARGRPG